MRLLLDTCTLLWFLTDDPKRCSRAKSAVELPSNQRWLSPVSLMEIALKVRLGKLSLPAPFGVLFPADLLAEDIHLLPIEPQHLEPLTWLPMHHKDPFDRAIAAIAMVEGLTLVSTDLAFDAYNLTRLW